MLLVFGQKQEVTLLATGGGLLSVPLGSGSTFRWGWHPGRCAHRCQPPPPGMPLVHSCTDFLIGLRGTSCCGRCLKTVLGVGKSPPRPGLNCCSCPTNWAPSFRLTRESRRGRRANLPGACVICASDLKLPNSLRFSTGKLMAFGPKPRKSARPRELKVSQFGLAERRRNCRAFRKPGSSPQECECRALGSFASGGSPDRCGNPLLRLRRGFPERLRSKQKRLLLGSASTWTPAGTTLLPLTFSWLYSPHPELAVGTWGGANVPLDLAAME